MVGVRELRLLASDRGRHRHLFGREQEFHILKIIFGVGLPVAFIWVCRRLPPTDVYLEPRRRLLRDAGRPGEGRRSHTLDGGSGSRLPAALPR